MEFLKTKQLLLKWIKYKKIYNDISVLKSNIDTNNFEKIATAITNKKNLLITNSLLKNIYSLENKDPFKSRIFLSIYMIAYDSDAVSNHSEYTSEVIHTANEVLQYLDILQFVIKKNYNINYFIKMFIQKLDNYDVMFSKWKGDDLNNLLEALFMSYYQITDMIETIKDVDDENQPSPYKSITILGFKDQLKEIEKSILKLDPHTGMDKLKEYKVNAKKVAISDDIYQVAQTAYWDNLKEQLSKNPPDFSLVLKLIEEIREKLQRLVPNRPEIKEEIKENMDINFIKQMIDHGVFKAPELLVISNFVFSKILEFESPECNEDTKQMKQKFEQKINLPNLQYSEIIPELFKNIYHKIEKIEDDMVKAINSIAKDAN